MSNEVRPPEVTDMDGLDNGPATSSRRHLLRLGAVAGVAAVGAASGASLLASPAGAAAGDAVTIDDTNTGGGGTTILEFTSGHSTVGSSFRAALQDWGGQVFNVQAYGATGNGSTDDTAAIHAAQLAAGNGCVFFPPGTYLVSGLTVATSGQTFKLEAGATIIASAGIAGPVITVAATGVSILGPGTVDGNEANQTATTGLDCVLFTAGADDGLVQSIVAQNAAWIGIETIGANRTHLVLNRVLNCNHAGISCTATSTSVDGPLVLGNVVLLNGTSVFSGINVQGSNATNVVNYADVVDNHVNVASGLSYQVANGSFTRVANNRGRGPGQVFSVVGGTDNVVTGNAAQPTGTGAGIELGSNNSVCIANTVSHSGAGAGIHADNINGTRVIIANNKITGAINSGIGVGSYDHVTVTGNMIQQSTSSDAGFGVIQVSPTGAGLVVIGDNVCDAAGGSSYGIWLNNLISTPIQTSIHDNAIAGIPAVSSAAALRLAGSGVFTDLLVHDNTIAAGTALYTMAPGLSFGNNVRFHHNIVVGQTPDSPTVGLGLSPLSLPASGTAYTNPGPFTEIVYVQGGKLTGTGAAQGVVKNGHVLAAASIILKTALAITLDPGEAITVYYTVAPTAFKDVKG
jgi:Pectate lyase superfamily protein